jgi:SAM-dependent methyltransferase
MSCPDQASEIHRTRHQGDRSPGVAADGAPFSAPAEAYDRFMGRYGPSLSAGLADFARIGPGMRVLDVGCGPGGLTHELVARVGTCNVAAIDPAAQFTAACRLRNPGVEVCDGIAENLPWPADQFDAALSCLVVGFMHDPDQGIREMARVVRPGGTVAACMWDMASGGMTMLRLFWTAVRTVDPTAHGEQQMAGTVEGDLAQRLALAGLGDVTGGMLWAQAHYVDFDDFWEPFTYRVGPAGQYLMSRSDQDRVQVRDACRAALPTGAFTLDARAWCARGTVLS